MGARYLMWEDSSMMPAHLIDWVPALDPRLPLQVVCSGMTWLVERQISTARKLDGGPQPPAHFPHRVRDRDALGCQVRERRLDVRAHQVEFLLRLSLSGVHSGLSWR